MKRLFCLISLMFFLVNINAQTGTQKFILGDWFCTSDKSLNLDVNESMSFSRVLNDSIYLKWSFKNDKTFTRSLAMQTPDSQGIIKYSSKSALWSIKENPDDTILIVGYEIQSYKILSIDQEDLRLKRTK